MYRITYLQGNGFTCSCCRVTYIITQDVATKKEVYDWLLTYKADLSKPLYDDDSDDRSLLSIERTLGENIQDQFVIDQKDIDHEVASRIRIIEEREAQEKRRILLKKEEEEISTLRDLAAKYPEVLKGV